MSRPIMLNDALIERYVKEFRDSISKMKLSDGKISYNKSLEYEASKDKITVYFTAAAYSKMIALVMQYSTEIAWHGVAERCDGGFLVKDILVYPQIVAGATANTDQEEYQKWFMHLDDDIVNHMRMQGHSHVKMSTSPSGVDTAYYDKIIAQLGKEDFYIFLIWNKSMSRTVKVYDMKENVMYEDKDIRIALVEEGYDMDAFLSEAKRVVKNAPAHNINPSTYPYSTYYASSQSSAKDLVDLASASKKNAEKPRRRKAIGEYLGYGYADCDDYDELIFGGRK